MVAETDGEKAAQWITSPIGGAAIAAFLYPMGCAKDVAFLQPCPSGEATNFLGWTVGGLVGSLDNFGLFVLGILIAVVLYYAIGMLQESRKGG